MHFAKAKQPILFKEHAYQEIKKAIILHEIKPGGSLYERSLSEELGISRTPLKLALQQLEQEGWVKSIPRKGILVKEISEVEALEVFQLRRANEVLVVELLIPLLDEEKMAGIEKMYQMQSELKGDPAKFVLFDTEFHLYLAELSENRRLYQLIKTLTDYFNWLGIAALNGGGRMDESYREHGLIVEGLKAGDLVRTREAVTQHIENTYQAVMKNLKNA